MEQRLRSSLTSRWFLQSAFGVLLVVLLGVHLIVNHWVAPGGLLTYEDVIRYYDIPGIAWMEIIFLIVVTAHCLTGLHAILLDMAPSSPVEKLITSTLVVMGFVIVVYGVWLIWEVKIR
jgi:succinate dehydrogenase hydrophobic anchor subunit